MVVMCKHVCMHVCTGWVDAYCVGREVGEGYLQEGVEDFVFAVDGVEVVV